MRITWDQALAWRLRRHHLLGPGADSAEAVVGRLTTVPATSGDPEAAVAMRLAQPEPGAVAAALAAGRLISTFTFRGSVHLVRPQDAGAQLAIRAAGRQWERRSWQQHYGLTPDAWPAFRATVRDALAAGPLTITELAEAVGLRYPQLRELFSYTLLKPLAWQGDLRLAPSRDGQVTVQSLADVPGFDGIPALDDAGPSAIAAYLSAYGPATPQQLQRWFGEGLSAGGRRIERWTATLGDRLAAIEVDGDPAVCLAEHGDDLAATEPTDAVRLLRGYDQWVLGPGTADVSIVPAALRPAVSRGADLVTVGGVVAGTWRTVDGEVVLDAPGVDAADLRG